MEKDKKSNCLNIGNKAPNFKATTTMGNLEMSKLKGRWVVLFSHPGDFTPVCTTEFVSFADYYDCFRKRNVELLGLSIDSNPSHLAWVYNIYENTGVTIPFPIIADRDGSISRQYGMIAKDVSSTETVRKVFIIDEKQTIRAMLTYPLTNGRNICEILRLVDALQFTDKTGLVTPANWVPGDRAMVPPPKTYDQLRKRQEDPSLDCRDWYWCYKKGKY